MKTLPKEVSEALAEYREVLLREQDELLRVSARLALESAILSALDAAREGALREAAARLAELLASRDLINLTDGWMKQILALASRPKPAPESEEERFSAFRRGLSNNPHGWAPPLGIHRSGPCWVCLGTGTISGPIHGEPCPNCSRPAPR